MWKPANSLYWQSKGECAKPENKDYVDLFFSSEISKKHEAKNLCFICPVRAECLQWALENKQLWGIWGGIDEFDLRRALSVSYTGEELKRKKPPRCPYCSARSYKLSVSTEKIPGGGRWTTAKIVTCANCNFSWRSRTSANAINAYKQEREERLRKSPEPPHTTSDS